MIRFPAYASLILAAALAGCSTLAPMQEDIAPMVGPAPRFNTTPMATALACLRTSGNRDLRVGVSDFVDGTGVMEGGTQNSRALSQRPDMMMVVALAASGAHLVNRSSVNVAEWELNKAMEKKLGDGRTTVVDSQRIPFRPVRAGTLLGSTHYVTGAITELNWNIDSGVAEAGAFSVSVGKRTYRISIAVDVVVTNTQTTEIVHARSYKKQLVGYETNANLFRFVNQDSALKIAALGNASAAAATKVLELFQANIGEKQNEPTQTALRWVIDLAAYDIMRNLKRTGHNCDTLLPPETFEDGVLPAEAAAGAPAAYAAPPLRRLGANAPDTRTDFAVLNDGASTPAATPLAFAAADGAPKAATPKALPAPIVATPVENAPPAPVAALTPAPAPPVEKPAAIARPARLAQAPTVASDETSKARPRAKAAEPGRWMSGGVKALGTELSSDGWRGSTE